MKNVGHNAIDSIVAARKELGRFQSIFEFCEKVDLRLLNKRVMESLIKSGAMDSLGRRAQLMAVLDQAMERAQKTQRDAESGQHGLFGVFDDQPAQHANNDKLPERPRLGRAQRLAAEKEILGFFITGHPLEKYRDKLHDLQRAHDRRHRRHEVFHRQGRDLRRRHHHQPARAEVAARAICTPRATLEDMAGSVDMLVFPEAYRRLGTS